VLFINLAIYIPNKLLTETSWYLYNKTKLSNIVLSTKEYEQ